MHYLMLMGRKAKSESPEEMAMVHHALENPTRRRMLILMNEGLLTVKEIARAVGDRMLDYQLHRMELLGPLEVHDGQITLTGRRRSY